MNKERAKELLPIIEAFVNGKVIEYLFVGEWRVATCPDWTPGVKYRIRQEPKLVPFTFEDNLLFRDKWIQYKNGYKNPKYKIIIYDEFKITIIGCNRNSFDYTYEKFMQVFEFEDGSPCGKYINE